VAQMRQALTKELAQAPDPIAEQGIIVVNS
jgi:hypothetical protein